MIPIPRPKKPVMVTAPCKHCRGIHRWNLVAKKMPKGMSAWTTDDCPGEDARNGRLYAEFPNPDAPVTEPTTGGLW